MSDIVYRFNPIDRVQMRLIGRLPLAKRVRLVLDARELAVGLIRDRLRRKHPDLSPEQISLKLLEELARAHRTPPRSWPVSGNPAHPGDDWRAIHDPCMGSPA